MQINSFCIIYNGKQLFTDLLGIKIKKTGYLERFGDESFVFFFLLKSRMIKLKFTSSNLLVPWLEIFSLESYCNNSKQNMNPT